VTLAKEFSHYRPILAFDESIIVGLAGSGFGEVHQPLAPLPDAGESGPCFLDRLRNAPVVQIHFIVEETDAA